MIKVGDIVYHRDDRAKQWFLVVNIDKNGCRVLPLESGTVQSLIGRHSKKRNLKRVGHFDGSLMDILNGRRTSIIKNYSDVDL